MVVLLMPALLLGGAAADHTCPLFERKPYEYTMELHLGGALYAREHVAGFVDFAECHELRHRVLTDEVRFETRDGAHALRIVTIEGEEDRYLLQANANVTRWYDSGDIHFLQRAGIGDDGEPSFDLGIPDARATGDLVTGVPLKIFD